MEQIINYKDIKKETIKFITIAEWGAMGYAGSVELLAIENGQLTLHYGNRNIHTGEKIMDMEEFYNAFSEFKNTQCFIGECRGLPEGWKYIDLGFGNNLFISEDVYDYFKTLLDSIPVITPYVTWKTCAIMTLILLENGIIDKKDFLAKINDINLKEHFEDCSVDNDSLYYVQFIKDSNKNYKEILLDKIANPNYSKNQTKNNSSSNLKFNLILFGIILIMILIAYIVAII
jgi:hypothetical protein